MSRRARPTDALELVALPITQRQSPFWRSTYPRHDPLRAPANHQRSVFFCKAICGTIHSFPYITQVLYCCISCLFLWFSCCVSVGVTLTSHCCATLSTL